MYGFRKAGRIRPRNTTEIADSRIGVGLEKLDRNLYDPSVCYRYIGELGAKWVRIQSGWCRTEKEKGVYDFAWLDDIVDNLLAQHVQPWMCLCYGNELYTPEANNRAGSVGRPPIHTEAERAAWDRYVEACVSRYRGKVRDFEIWNEPDGAWCWRPNPDPREYGDFALRTARAIKRANPDARVLAGSFCRDFDFFYRFMTPELAALTDAVTFHRYQFDVDNGLREHVRNIRAVLDDLRPGIGIIQGETGAQSAFSTHGALRGGAWTERKQAKYLLREVMINLSTEVEMTSWFSLVDIFENIQNDEVRMEKSWYGFFGLLGETFDEHGAPMNHYEKKEAFTAMQTLCAVFDGSVKRRDLPVRFITEQDAAVGGWNYDANRPDAGFFTQGFEKENGTRGFVYWKPGDIMTEEFASSVSMDVYGVTGEIRLVDLYDGKVYALPEEAAAYDGGIARLRNLPLRDYPMLITFGDFAETDAAGED